MKNQKLTQRPIIIFEIVLLTIGSIIWTLIPNEFENLTMSLTIATTMMIEGMTFLVFFTFLAVFYKLLEWPFYWITFFVFLALIGALLMIHATATAVVFGFFAPVSPFLFWLWGLFTIVCVSVGFPVIFKVLHDGWVNATSTAGKLI